MWLCGRGKGEGVSGTDLEYNNIAELKFQIENLTYTLWLPYQEMKIISPTNILKVSKLYVHNNYMEDANCSIT